MSLSPEGAEQVDEPVGKYSFGDGGFFNRLTVAHCCTAQQVTGSTYLRIPHVIKTFCCLLCASCAKGQRFPLIAFQTGALELQLGRKHVHPAVTLEPHAD